MSLPLVDPALRLHTAVAIRREVARANEYGGHVRDTRHPTFSDDPNRWQTFDGGRVSPMRAWREAFAVETGRLPRPALRHYLPDPPLPLP